MSAIVDATAEVIYQLQNADPRKLHQIAMQWPSFAVALHDLIDAYGERPPGTLRHAARIAREKT
jgi:hypothetical protein